MLSLEGWNSTYFTSYTRSINTNVVFDGLLRWLTESTYFTLVAPEVMIASVLLLYEFIGLDVGSEEGGWVSGYAVFGEVTESTAEFILAVFTWDVSTVSWDLSTWVSLTHIFITSLMEL